MVNNTGYYAQWASQLRLVAQKGKQGSCPCPWRCQRQPVKSGGGRRGGEIPGSSTRAGGSDLGVAGSSGSPETVLPWQHTLAEGDIGARPDKRSLSRWSGRRATRRRWGARRDSSRAALWQEAATFGVALSMGKSRWCLLELMVGEAVKGDGEQRGEQHGTVAMVLAATIVPEGGQRALSPWMCSADTAATRANRSGRWLGLKTGHPLGT
jgi:hypothetical protein